jgi:hypothetical protein
MMQHGVMQDTNHDLQHKQPTMAQVQSIFDSWLKTSKKDTPIARAANIEA